MKNIALVLALIFAVTLDCSCQKKRNNPEKGLLWEISGNGLKEKSYLFGTWHGSTGVCIDFLDSIPNFYKVFNSVSQYVGESVGGADYAKEVTDALKGILGELWMPQDSKYPDLLDKKDTRFLDSLLLKYIGATSSEVNIRPNYLYFTLSAILADKSYIETKNEKCKIKMDNYLQLKAEEKNDSLVGLDSPETMKKAMTEIFLRDLQPGTTLKENADYLVKQIREGLAQEENADLNLSLRNMEDAYRNMDLKNLVKYKNESLEMVKKTQTSESEFDYYFLLIGRNKIWMEKIPALINERPTFIAVGALHLCGDEGLISLLREKGYKVKPVK